MRRFLFVWRCLLAVPGIALLWASVLLLETAAFGTWRFVVGLMLHLVGQAGCISSLCLPAWWRRWLARQFVGGSALPASSANGIRAAHFRLEVQVIRLLYGVGLTILLAGWLIVGALGLRNLLRLRVHGVPVNAAITGTSFRENGAMLTVTYAFPTSNGLPVTDTFRAARYLLPSLRTGNLLPITYLPADPNIHSRERVNNTYVARHCLSGIALFATFLAYAGLPFVWAERRLRRQLRLARVGIGITGTIVACKPLLWRKTRRGYLLTYAFATPGQNVILGRALVPYVTGEPTLPEFPLTILYDPLFPGISLPLAAFHTVEMTNVRKTVYAT